MQGVGGQEVGTGMAKGKQQKKPVNVPLAIGLTVIILASVGFVVWQFAGSGGPVVLEVTDPVERYRIAVDRAIGELAVKERRYERLRVEAVQGGGVKVAGEMPKAADIEALKALVAGVENPTNAAVTYDVKVAP